MKQKFKIGNIDVQNGFCNSLKLENIELEIEISAEEIVTRSTELMKLFSFIREEAPKWKEIILDISTPTKESRRTYEMAQEEMEPAKE